MCDLIKKELSKCIFCEKIQPYYYNFYNRISLSLLDLVEENTEFFQEIWKIPKICLNDLIFYKYHGYTCERIDYIENTPFKCRFLKWYMYDFNLWKNPNPNIHTKYICHINSKNNSNQKNYLLKLPIEIIESIFRLAIIQILIINNDILTDESINCIINFARSYVEVT